MLILKVANSLTLQNMYSNPHVTYSHKKHCLPKTPKGKKSCGDSLQAPESSSISLQLGIGQAWPWYRLQKACQGNPDSGTLLPCFLPQLRVCISVHSICLYFQYFSSHQQYYPFQVKVIELRSRATLRIPQAAQLYPIFKSNGFSKKKTNTKTTPKNQTNPNQHSDFQKLKCTMLQEETKDN